MAKKRADNADVSTNPATGLDAVSAVLNQARVKGSLPPHLWNPPFCGDINMRIARDGTWFYEGTPIGRPALVKLFSSVLRKELDRFVLVTPVEKVGIVVEDAPFIAVAMVVEETAGGQVLHFRTNVEDWVTAGAEHALRFEKGAAGGLKPYVHVRGELWALVARSVFYDLVASGSLRDVAGKDMFGIVSGGAFFPMAPADEIEDLV
jgi:hypothetical protein